MNQELWNACIAFHGHECPGLAIGFRAAHIAMDRIGAMAASGDEEVVCVTENDACGVDAVQFITGCTLGKGNLIYRPTGKMAFSFFNRTTGKKVRILMKPKPDPDMSREEWKEFLLTGPEEETFLVLEPSFEPPERARLFNSVVCSSCGESAPEHRMRLQDGKPVCMDCAKTYSRGW